MENTSFLKKFYRIRSGRNLVKKMSHSFPNVYLTRSYKILMRSYTINIFLSGRIFIVLDLIRQNFCRVRSDKSELINCLTKS